MATKQEIEQVYTREQEIEKIHTNLLASFKKEPIDKEQVYTREQQIAQIHANLLASFKHKPDDVAAQKRTAQSLDVPIGMVKAYPDIAQERAKMQQIDNQIGGLTILPNKLTNPNYTAVAHDDLDNLGNIERILGGIVGGPVGAVISNNGIDNIKETSSHVARGIGSGVVGGTASAVSGRGEFFQAAYTAFLSQAMRLLPKPESQSEEEWQANREKLIEYNLKHNAATNPSELSKGWKYVGEQIENLNKQYIDTLPDDQKNFADQVFNGIGQLVPYALDAATVGGAGNTFKIGKLLKFMPGLAMGADQMAKQVRDDNASEVDKSKAILLGSSFTAVSEKIAFEKMLPGIGKLEQINTPTIRQSLGKVIGAGIAEGAQEASENLVQDALQHRYTNPEHQISLGQALQAGGVGSSVGGIISVFGQGIFHIHAKARQSSQSVNHTVQLKQALDQHVQASKLAKRDPETFAETMQDIAGSHTLYLDAQTLHQSGIAEALTEISPSIAKQYPEALQTGGAVAIPMGEYLANIAPNAELANQLTPIARLNPDGDTLAEVQQFHAEDNGQLKAEIESQAKAAQTAISDTKQTEAVEQDIYSQLKQVGRYNDTVNRTHAAVAANTFRVLAERLNIPIEQLYQDYKLHVNGEAANGAVLNQALAAHPPRGWKHAENPQDAQDLWNGDLDASAVFWTGGVGKLGEQIPEISDYSISINKDSINHIRKEHGDLKQEALRGQIAITKNDISAIPEIIRNYDAMRNDLVSDVGNQRLLFAKKVDDGTLVLVSEISKNKRDIRSVSMWKYPLSIDEQRAIQIAVTSNQTFKTNKGMSHGENLTSTQDENQYYQSALTPEQQSFNATAEQYGGEEAYQNHIYHQLDDTERQAVIQPVRQANTFIEAREQAKVFQGMPLLNAQSGIEAIVSRNSLDKMLSKKAVGKSADPAIHALAVANADRLFEHAILGWSKPDRSGDPNIAAVHRFFSVMENNNKTHLVKMTVKELSNPNDANRYYTIEAVELNEKTPAASWVAATVQEDHLDPTSIRSAGVVQNLAEFVEKSNRNKEVLFQLDEQTNSAFANAVDSVANGEKVSGHIKVGTTPDVLKMLGLPDVSVMVGGDVLHKVMKGKHKVTADALKELPKEINNPVAVMKSNTKANGYVVLTELTEQVEGIDKPVIAALHLKKTRRGLSLINIASAYGKNLTGLQAGLENNLLYWHKTKGPQLLNRLALQLRPGFDLNSENLQDKNIKTDSDLSQYQAQKKLQQQAPVQTVTPRGAFNPDSRTISLLKGADLSTWYHELGHFYLEMNLDVVDKLMAKQQAGVELSPSEAQMVYDFNHTIMDWFGVQSLKHWQAMSFEARREYHEQFARGFEQYLMMGEAPNQALRSIFRKVRDWMVRIYKKLTALNVSLNPEVKQVFDRLVATDEEIELAQANRSMRPLFESQEQSGMSVEDFQRYQDLTAQAKAEAREQLQGKAIRDMAYIHNAHHRHLSALKRQARIARQSIEADVSKAVMAQPVYQVWQRLTDRRKASEATQESSPVPLRLHTGSLKELGLSDVEIKLMQSRHMTSNKQGLHPDLVAASILDSDGNPHYPSGQAMIQAILQAEPPHKVIENQTDAIMQREHGELSSPEAIAEAADVAVHNQVRLRILNTEYNALSQALGKRRLILDAAKQYATEVIAAQRVQAIHPRQYRKMAEKAGRYAEQAMKKGDLETAASEKRNQILQMMLAQEAQNALDTVRVIEATWKKWANKARHAYAKSYDTSIVESVKAVMGMYGVAVKKGERAADYLEVIKHNDPEKLESVQSLINRAIQDTKSDGTHKMIHDLSVAELQALHEELSSNMAYARRSQHMVIKGKKEHLDEVAQKVRMELEKNAVNLLQTDFGGLKKAATASDKAKLKLATLYYSGRRVENWCGVVGQSATRYIFKPIKDAAVQYRLDKADMYQRFKEILQPIQAKFKGGKIEATELGYTFNGMNELIHAILHTGNDSNKRKLLLGYQWATENEAGELDTRRWDAFMARMFREGVVDKDVMDACQNIWDFMESHKGKAQQAFYEVNGHYFDEISAKAINTPYGEYRGGYVPAVIDVLKTDTQLRDSLEQENQSLSYAFPKTAQGFTKKRVEYNRPLLLDMRLLTQHADQVLKFSHMEVPGKDVMRLLNKIKGDISKHHRGALEAMLVPWLNRAVKQQVSTPMTNDGGFGRFLAKMRSNAGMSVMMLNVLNALQQVSGFAMAGTVVKKRYLLSASAQYLSSPRAMAKQVAELSPYMRERLEGNIGAIQDHIHVTLVNPNLLEKAQNFTARNAYYLQQVVDNVMSPQIWTAAYQQALDSGMSEDAAIDAADKVIRTTQGSTSPEDISRIETGSPFVRLFTQFWGYFNMQANLLGDGLTKILQDGGLAKNKAAAAHLFLMAYMIPAAVAEAIAQAFSGGPDDEDGDGYLDDWIQAVLLDGPIRNLTAMIPGVGQVAVGVYDKIKGVPYAGRLASSPAVEMASTAINAPFSIAKAIHDDGSHRKAVRDVGTLIGITLGLPTYAMARPVGYLAGVENDEIEPTGAVDLMRGVMTGTPSMDSRR